MVETTIFVRWTCGISDGDLVVVVVMEIINFCTIVTAFGLFTEADSL